MSTQQRNQTMEEAVINNFIAPSLWLDYTDKTTLIKTGTSVTSWKDKSNNNLVATTTGTAPIDDGTGIKFGSANDTNLVVTGLFNTGHENFTIITVRKPNADTPTPNIDVNYSTSNYYTAVFDNHRQIESFSPNTNGVLIGAGSTKMGNLGKATGILIETSRFGNGKRTLGIDYRILTRRENGSMGLTGDFIIGTNTPNGARARQTFSEILVFPRYLTDQEVMQVTRYLDKKYSVVSVGRKHYANSQIHFVGDSLTVGWGPDTGQGYSFNYPNQTMELLGSGFYNNTAVAGFTVPLITPIVNENSLTAYSNRFDKNVVNVWIGTNDLNTTSKTGAQVGAEILALCQTLRNQGWKVSVTTCLPRTAAGVPADFETRRTDLNNYLAANFATSADALVDLRTDAQISAAGASDNTTFFDPDKIHMTIAGYARVAAIVTPVLRTLLASS